MFFYQKGSEWRKWDLHVHTPASRGDITGSWIDSFINEINTSDVAVIAITDYFTLDGYGQLLRHQNKLKKTVLPGIELRLEDSILPSRHSGNNQVSDRPINIQIIFDNDENIYQKVQEFVQSLEFKDFNNSSNALTRTNIITLGKQSDSSISDIEAFKKGCEQIRISKDEITHKLKEKKIRDRAIIVLPYEKYGGIDEIDPETDSLIKSRLVKLADVIESSNEKQIKFFLGSTEKLPYLTKQGKINKEFLQHIGNPKPSITGSDAHSYANIGKFSNSRCCWIKADPIFDGLKQIIFEPEERVCIQKECPEPVKSIYSIQAISVENSKINKNLGLKEMAMPLNSNLVAIIGGKGSGKTALVDLIANCYPNKINPANKNSFINRIAGEGSELKTKITFLNKSEFEKRINDNNYITNSDIEYIPQGQIETKIGDAQAFHEYLQALIFNSNKIKTSKHLFEYQQMIEKIKEDSGKIYNLNEEIYTIEGQIKTAEAKNLGRQIELRNTQKIDIQNKLSRIKTELGKEKMEEIQQISKKLGTLQEKRQKLSKLLHLTRKAIEALVLVDELNNSLGEINSLINDLGLRLSEIKSFEVYDTKAKLESVERNTNEKLRGVNEEIRTIQSTINKLEEDKKEHVVLLTQLNNVIEEFKQLQIDQKEIGKLKECLLEKEKTRKELFLQQIKQYIKLKEKYKEIINEFSEDRYDILLGIDFDASLFFDFNKFAEIGEDVLDLRTIRESKTQKASILECEIMKNLVGLLEKILDTQSKNCDRVLANLSEELTKRIMELIPLKKSTRTTKHFYEWLFSDYFFLRTETYFNKIPLDKLSLGQKCTVLLKVYLAQGNNPIIIDQPDDNLDNIFIMDELVNAIRKAKMNRQVIIVSNNANVVINSDAEQIIVAEFQRGEISYIGGAIENPIIRSKAIGVLEGGRIAFEKRESKYGFLDKNE